MGWNRVDALKQRIEALEQKLTDLYTVFNIDRIEHVPTIRLKEPRKEEKND
jgi:uncharacterized circularly permuted ATP-grasp superfamily protein